MALGEQDYGYLKRQIASLLEIDIDAYKEKQMRRRLESFVAAHVGDGESMTFLRSLSSDAEALGELRDMLTINVSEFFRDAKQFELLEQQVLPDLLKGRTAVNIWSAACSYGHEPYSVAMILDDLSASRRSNILATDFDRRMLARAKAGGPYPKNETRNISPERVKRYFTEVDGRLEINRTLRARVQFEELNLLRDKFATGFDLIICRNVMIYFSAGVKRELVSRYWDSLVPGGVLFVGATEALLGEESAQFERLGGNFYRKPADAAPASKAA